MYLNLLTLVDQVWRTYFWMGAFGGPRPKRHQIHTNHPDFAHGIHGRGGYLPISKRQETCTGLPLVIKDKKGKFTGVKERLKASQPYGLTSEKCCFCFVCLVWGHLTKFVCLSLVLAQGNSLLNLVVGWWPSVTHLVVEMLSWKGPRTHRILHPLRATLSCFGPIALKSARMAAVHWQGTNGKMHLARAKNIVLSFFYTLGCLGSRVIG